MRVLVCYKLLPDFEQILPGDWEHFSMSTDIGYAKRVLNCFDESALELALQLRDACGCTVDAVTVGTAPPAYLRKTLFAVGFQELYVLQSSPCEFCTREISELLAAFVREQPYELILCGAQAGYADSGMLPLLLAQSLGLPVYTQLQSLEMHGDTLEVTRLTDSGVCRMSAPLPALCTVGNSPVAALRPATLRTKLEAEKREITLRELPPIQSAAQPVLSPVSSARRCRFAEKEELLALLTGEGQAVQPSVQPQKAQPGKALRIAYALPGGDGAPLGSLLQLTAGLTKVSETLLVPGFVQMFPLPDSVSRVLYCKGGSTDAQLQWLARRVREMKPELLLFPGSFAGQEYAVRISAILGCGCITQVQALDGGTALRRVMSNHMQQELPLSDFTVLAAARGLAGKEFIEREPGLRWEEIPLTQDEPDSGVLLEQFAAEQDTAIESAQRLIVAGKGMGSKEACDALRQLAQRLGFSLAFTRPAAVNGWGGLEQVVGQSGKVTAPKICLTLGVSGSCAFLAGVEQAQTMIAVNTDPHAPIFKAADIGIVADVKDVMELLHDVSSTAFR